jgi:glycosyltransferase involved in cell wall biosynthesis
MCEKELQFKDNNIQLTEKIRQKIEHSSFQGAHFHRKNCIEFISKIKAKQANWISTAKAIMLNHFSPYKKQQLFVDVSELIQRDAKTGIQRVVKNILHELLLDNTQAWRVEPVYMNKEGLYEYARQFTLNFIGIKKNDLPNELIEVKKGDTFFGLDFCSDLIPFSTETNNEMQQSGVKTFYVVYDLIPVNHPHFFPQGANVGFEKWLKHISQYADGIISISKATENDFNEWLKKSNIKRAKRIATSYFHLGSNIENIANKEETIENFNPILKKISRHQNILMTGTIEPRKGHYQALLAFEILWKKNIPVNLTLVGKTGWLIDELLKKTEDHPEKEKHFFWFKNATDFMLKKIYAHTTGFLMASEAEGFGLPLIEAAQYGIPLLARDIPIFKEIAQEHATYFSGTTPESLATALEKWLKELKNNTAISSKKIKPLSWNESYKKITQILKSD